MKFFRLFFLILVITSISFSQFDKPVLQFGIGLVQPFDDLKGNYYRYDYSYGIPLLAPDTNLFANNFGAKTGLYFYGKGKINFDKYNIFRAMTNISFNTFNTFEPTKSGNIGVKTSDTTIYPSSATYNYSFNIFAIGIGLEIAPLAFTNVFSPYFGANMTFNFMNAKLTRTEGFNDSVSFNASGFRIGFNLDCGIEAKFSKTIGAVLGIKYDLGNLLLKNVYSGISDRYMWGNTSASLNDEQGSYFSGLQSPIDPPPYYGQVNSKRKTLDWGTIYLGINIYFPTNKTSPTKK